MSIAVCGIGIVSAIGIGAGETLGNLRTGRSGIGKPTLLGSAVGVPVGEVKRDNAALGELLGIPEREHPSRTALLGMAAAAQAVADAAIPAGARVALVSGTSVGGMDLTENFYRDFRTDKAKGRLRDVAGHDCADSTQRIARYCGIGGYTATVSTACSSAANAIVTGALLLGSGMADYVVAGGTDALCRFTLNGFNSLSVLDREPCRPFDATRAGLNLGEGAGYLVLTHERPGMRTYCRLTGYANANDAYHQTASSQTGEGAYRAMAGALAQSGLRCVDYINVHGTATPNNDLTEGTALRRLFGGQVPPFSSTTGYTGHALAAAGAGYHTRAALRQPRIRGADPGARAAPRSTDARGRRTFGALQFVRVRRQLLFINLCQMKLYVNCITSDAGLRRDIKELIPEMNLRRRMSRVVKSGVAAGIESLLEFGDRAAVEAVVTATGLGCIADSEKFLDSLIANEERMLNPTPFIQSTFNTVGAQIALLRGLHCYNTTYANRWTSFENALTDAALRIGAGLSRAVLVGAFDETTPSVEKVLQRLGMAQQGGWGESSVFFVLTAEAFDTSVAAITGIRFKDGTAIGERAGSEFPDGESAGTGRIQSREDAGTRTSAGGNAGREIPAGGSPGTGTAAGNGEEPGNAMHSGECRTVRASMSGVTPHFTAIAEVFRRVVAGEAGNTGKAGNIGNAGSIEDTGNAGQRIVLYNDFPGSTVSAIELTCM